MRTCLTIIWLFLWPALARADSADLLLIEKELHQLTLFSDTKVLMRFAIALGRAPKGAKNCQGDKKTPEGIYQVTGRNPGSAFYKSLRVSYPNRSDQQRAKLLRCAPGGDIMIHGLPNGQGWVGAGHRLVDWTDGCIAVTNAEMDQIWAVVPNGTRVEIRP